MGENVAYVERTWCSGALMMCARTMRQLSGTHTPREKRPGDDAFCIRRNASEQYADCIAPAKHGQDAMAVRQLA
jgi:hypothetical protein